jgi:hypothetical protein
MHVIDMADFADGGLIREKSFIEQVESLEMHSFKGEEVFIKGCAQMPIPTWAFMMLAARVAQVADMITFGEENAPFIVFERAQTRAQ